MCTYGGKRSSKRGNRVNKDVDLEVLGCGDAGAKQRVRLDGLAGGPVVEERACQGQGFDAGS